MHRTTSELARTAALFELTRELAGVRRAEKLYASIARQVKQVLDAPTLCISLVGDDGRARIAFASGVTPDPASSYDPSESETFREGRAAACEPGAAPIAQLVGRTGSRALVAPVRCAGQVIGEVVVLGGDALGHQDEDVEWLDAVAGIVAAGVDLVQSADQADLNRREAERIEEISRAIIAALDLDSVLQRVVAAALDLATADYAAVWLRPDPGSVVIASALGALAPRTGVRAPLDPETVAAWVSQPRAAVLRPNDIDGSLKPLRPLLPGAVNILVPLVREDQLLGCLAAGQRADQDQSAARLRVVRRLGSSAAIAIANHELQEKVRNLSLTDPLTGLANRRHLDMYLSKEFAAARRGRRLSLLILDIDDFKQYNDSAGQAAGDAVLRAVADVLRDQTRAMNLAARFGGDEFVVVLSEADRRAAFIHARRVANAIRADALLGKLELETSVGIATYNARMQSPLELIRAADRDLHQRKDDPNARLSI